MRWNLLGGVALLALIACRMDARQQVAVPDTSGARSVDSTPPAMPPDTSAVAGFVRAFYDWYVPKALEGKSQYWIVLRERPGALSDSLRRAIAVDSLAQTRAVGEIDGIDWDPYLASQDPCDRYEVGAHSRVDDSTDAVPVFAVCGGNRLQPAAIIATVRSRGSARQFIDFRAPGDSLGLIDHIWLLHPRKGRTP